MSRIRESLLYIRESTIEDSDFHSPRSFATSVGSGTLKLWQAIIIAGIFEFAGAVGLGSETTKTVAGDITNLSYFQKQPEM